MAHFLFMKKILILSLLLISLVSVMAQGLQSPEQFLGYIVGTRFTRHHRIVEYDKAVAQAKPDMVKIEK